MSVSSVNVGALTATATVLLTIIFGMLSIARWKGGVDAKLSHLESLPKQMTETLNTLVRVANELRDQLPHLASERER